MTALRIAGLTVLAIAGAGAACLAVPRGALNWYVLAALCISLMPLISRLSWALPAAALVLLAHLGSGLARAGSASFSGEEYARLLLCALVLLAATAAQCVVRQRAVALRAVIWAGAVLCLLPALSAQRAAFHPIVRASQYIAMHDGTLLAADHYLPRGLPAGKRLPTIVTFQRYHRATALNFPFSLVFSPSSGNRERLAQAGYATVIVDVRGAGASTGYREAEMAPREVDDYVEVVDWIIAQPWSNGIVGAEGVSYGGTAAELLMLRDHPAVRAIATQYSLFDSYSEAAFPGGLLNLSIGRTWGQMLEALDTNQPVPGLAGLRKWAWGGVAPVPGAEQVLQRALSEHARSSWPHAIADTLRHRDQVMAGHTAFLYSPAGNLQAYRSNDTPLLAVSGWADGGYARGALRKFHNRESSDTWLVLGPWNHGPSAVTDPCAGDLAYRGRRSDFTLPFYDYFLRGIDNGFSKQGRIRYFTYCANRWKSTEQWPPGDDVMTLQLAADGLVPSASSAGSATVPASGAASSGEATRWHALAALPGDPPTHYADRAAQAPHTLSFASAPLEQPLVLSGSAGATLVLSSSAEDAAVFAYLEDVAPDGSVNYVTEAQLRLQHRRTTDALWQDDGPVRAFRADALAPLKPGERYTVALGFHPVSYRLAAGHRLQLSLANSDRHNFAPPGSNGQLTVHFGAAQSSSLRLPLEPAGQPIWDRPR